MFLNNRGEEIVRIYNIPQFQLPTVADTQRPQTGVYPPPPPPPPALLNSLFLSGAPSLSQTSAQYVSTIVIVGEGKFVRGK